MIRTSAALLAAVAVGALGAAAPAAAAPADGLTCVVRVENPDRQTCFGTFRDALQFASAGALRYGAKNAGEALRDPAFRAAVDAANAKADRQVSAGVAADTVLSIEYEDPNYGGLGRVFTGSSGNCSTSTNNVDYEHPAISAAWNNRISSFESYANCWVQHFESPWFGGASVGPTGSRSSLGLLDDQTTSLRWT